VNYLTRGLEGDQKREGGGTPEGLYVTSIEQEQFSALNERKEKKIRRKNMGF